MTRQSQGTALFTALLVLIGVDLVVQLWLLAASVDAVLRHEAHIPLRAALGSLLLFLVNGGLLLYVFGFDRKIRGG
jgi:hypothetical protein